jgi:hypothetical protein
MEDIREQMDLAQEISDAIAQPLDTTVDEVLLFFIRHLFHTFISLLFV